MLGLILAQVDKALEVVDRASVASDRWLFLAILLLLILAGGVAIRYLVKSNAEERTAHAKVIGEMQAATAKTIGEMQTAHAKTIGDMQTAHNKFVEDFYTEHVKLAAQVLVVLQEINPVLRWFKDHQAGGAQP